MNAERLHSIALALQADLAATDEVSLIRQLAQSLGQQVLDPTQGAQTAALREQLNQRLGAAASDSFSAAWHQTLDELRVSDLFGEELRQQVEEIFLRHEITPAAAADELTAIAERLEKLAADLEQLVAGLDALGIGAEELAPGEFEVGFLIPRDAVRVRDELGNLGTEFRKLKEILGPVQELATGTRDEVKVRTISSSGFQVFLEALPQVAQMMSQIVESLLSSYEKIRRIRDRNSDMKDDGVPDEVLEPLIAHANKTMEIDITALTERLIEEHGQSLRGAGRQHEIRVDISRSLVALANRIDEGYSIEVRSYELPEPDGAEEEVLAGLSVEAETARRIIEERQPRMRAMNLTGTRILQLPEGDDEPSEEPEGQGEDISDS